MAFTAEYVYRILDRYSGPLDKITRSTNKFQGAAKKAARMSKNLGAKLEKVGQSMANFRNVIGGAAITAGLFKFAQSASTMEDAMADVERVTGLTGKQLDAMKGKLQAMGRYTGRSAEGLAAIAYEGGKLGITNDKLEDFVMMVTKTAASFDMVDSEAGRAIGSIRSKLGLTVGSVNTLMQRINFLADNTSASGDQMINIVERTSATFKTLDIPPEVSAGWAAFANQVTVSSELGASGLNMMMKRMMKMPGMMDKMLKDPKNAVINFLKKFEKIPAAERGAAILKTFGDEAGTFVMSAVANSKLLEEAMEKAASTDALGSMDREFANILSRSSTAGKRIKETFIDISRTIGNVFLKVFDKYSAKIIKVTGYMLEFVKTHPGLVKIVGVTAAILAGITAIVVPIGVLFSIIAGGMPILTALSGAVAAISFPVVMAVIGIVALVTWIGMAYAKSEKFRAAVSNLASAFAPLVGWIKTAVLWIGTQLGMSLADTGNQAKTWGDIFAIVINGVAMYFKTLFDLIGKIGSLIKNVFLGDFAAAFGNIQSIFEPVLGMFDSLMDKMFSFSDSFSKLKSGDFSGAWASMKDNIGMGAATEKATARSQNKMEVSGKIDVSASGNAEVKKSNINLNTGSNIMQGI